MAPVCGRVFRALAAGAAVVAAAGDVRGYEPVPAAAHAGEEGFMRVADALGNSTDGMAAEMQSNPLNFPTLTDFWCAWKLRDRKRVPALLIDDMQVDYAAYVKGIVPQTRMLVDAFRKAGLPIYWSAWWRFGPRDGKFNAMDRFYGAVGWRTAGNALYMHDQEHGGDILEEIGPINDEERKRVMHKSYSLDMFDERPMGWLVPDGQGTLHSELQKLGVDTVVQVGAWTDDCIIATAFHAFGLQYDVVLVEDGVSTASKQHFNAIEVMRGAVANVALAADVAAYIGEGLPVHPAMGPAPAAAPAGEPVQLWQQARASHGPLAATVQPAAPQRATWIPEVANALNTVVVGGLGVALGFLAGRTRRGGQAADSQASGFAAAFIPGQAA